MKNGKAPTREQKKIMKAHGLVPENWLVVKNLPDSLEVVSRVSLKKVGGKPKTMTEEGELFYEDEEGDASYGWSLLDFMQGEYDDFTQMEIQQRIRSKMSKRDYIDAGSIQTTVNFDGHIYHIRIAFRRTDSNSEYNIDIESNGVEVIVE